TFSNIEQLSINFIRYTMRPWYVRWEQVINKKLLGPTERKELFAEFNMEGLLRGVSADRASFYNTMFQIGSFSPNDIRDMENENPIPGGDTYYVPLNMVPVGQPIQEPEPTFDGVREVRQRKQTGRFRMRESFVPMFRDAALRLIRGERRTVMAEARKQFKQRGRVEFEDFLDKYYGDGGAGQEFIRKTMAPAITSLMETIAIESFGEIGQEPSLDAKANKFIDDYINSFVFRYSQSSRNQLNFVVNETDVPQEDVIDSLDVRFDEWEERRPRKVSTRETVQGSNAMAKFVFVSGGFGLVWVASGSEPCPYCLEMDGRTVGRSGGEFVAQGEGVNGEGETKQ
ncbi:hypothetical protein LCGC14_3123250, partial [marine sediment metagenome]